MAPNCCADRPYWLCFSPQVTKAEKHGSGNDSDYDNTQTYDISLRLEPTQVTFSSVGSGFNLIACIKRKIYPMLKVVFALFCLVFLRLSGSGLQSQQFEQGDSKVPLHGHFHQLLPGDTKKFPNQPRTIISPGSP